MIERVLGQFLNSSFRGPRKRMRNCGGLFFGYVLESQRRTADKNECGQSWESALNVFSVVKKVFISGIKTPSKQDQF